MPTTDTFVVAGATGRFELLVEVLLARGHAVRALVRDPRSAAATRLRGLGAEVIVADFDDVASLTRAASGAGAMFATGTAHRSGPAGELRHGRNVADAAAATGTRLVYSSGDGAAPDSPLPLLRAKFEVERHIRSLGIAHMILAPVYFMENLFNPWNLQALRAGVLPSPVPVDAPLQQVAFNDVVAFAALALERSGELAGQRIALASDELTAIDAAGAIEELIGVPLEPRQLPSDGLPPGLQALFGWLEHVGHAVDIDGLKCAYPELGWHSFAGWLATQRSRFGELCPLVAH